MTPLELVLKARLPRCLSDVDTTAIDPPEPRECTVTAFSLSRKSSDDAIAQVFGYSLADYNPSCESDPGFIGPITLRWMDGAQSCVFDSDIHGYHGEMHSSTKFRGEGPAKAFECNKCGHDHFRLTVQFDYGDACDDLLEDGVDLPVQGYFRNILFLGGCAICGNVNRILDMDL